MSDGALMARKLFCQEKADLLSAVSQSRNGRRLLSHPELREDVPFCLRRDVLMKVPQMNKDGQVSFPGRIALSTSRCLSDTGRRCLIPPIMTHSSNLTFQEEMASSCLPVHDPLFNLVTGYLKRNVVYREASALGGLNRPEPSHYKNSMRKLLALNRGEITIRILRAASELGLRTVAVYSQEDRLSLHRFKADEAYLIGEGKGPVQAYLDAEGIVAMAAEKGVDAIHPGYGFLAENPALPRACEAAGIRFVGPSAELLELLGDKTAARRLAQKARVPVIPGTEQPVTTLEVARTIGKEIGFPLIVKAAFGGGGRGMRIVLT